jgi:hypothetical protein
MSTLLEAQDGHVYTGYDNLQAIQFCTPVYLSCKACITASVVNNYLQLVIVVYTPFGNVDKAFKITQGGTFTWEPFSSFKLDVSITNFDSSGDKYRFDAGFNICLKVPYFGWKCAGTSNRFDVPKNIMLKSAPELSEADFTNQLILQLLLEKESKACNCH